MNVNVQLSIISAIKILNITAKFICQKDLSTVGHRWPGAGLNKRGEPLQVQQLPTAEDEIWKWLTCNNETNEYFQILGHIKIFIINFTALF